MARVEYWFDQDLQECVSIRTIKGVLFTADNSGNLFGVKVSNKGEAVELSGSVSANVIRPDGVTISVSGTISGNQAYVVLPSTAYTAAGEETIILKNTDSSVVTTLLAVVITVISTT